MVVVPLKRTPGTVKNLKSPDEMDMEEVLTSECVEAKVFTAKIEIFAVNASQQGEEIDLSLPTTKCIK